MSNDYQEWPKAKLFQYLEEEHGHRVANPSKTSKQEIIDLILEKEGVAVPSTSAMTAASSTNEEGKKLKAVTINIHKTTGKHGNADVFVGTTHKAYNIKRGINVTVPVAVYNALELAVQTEYHQSTDSQSGKNRLDAVKVHSYPFSVIERIYE